MLSAMNRPLPDADSAMQMLRGAIGQIEFARRYTLELLDTIPHEHWYRMTDDLPTNVAWQAGHLAVSQYGLLLFRLRGRMPEDLELIPGKFRKTYGRGSAASADAASQPSPAELIDRMTGVHQLAMSGLQQVEPSVLLEPVDMPYAAFPIKLGAVLFCPLHEHIHAGQIGLLRRSLGLQPIH